MSLPLALRAFGLQALMLGSRTNMLCMYEASSELPVEVLAIS